MTQKEKIIMLKETIIQLYEKEGRTKSYIARLLKVDRKTLSNVINHEWELKQANTSYLTPSNQKFLNRNKQLIKSHLDRDFTAQQIAEELGVKSDYLRRTIIPRDNVLDKAMKDNLNRRNDRSKNFNKEQSSLDYNIVDIVDIEGEEWKEVLGYNGYYVSNHGRVKSYKKTYDDFVLLKQFPHPQNGRLYVWIGNKGLQVARLVGFAFVEGYSDTNNTINHKDLDVTNNKDSNLEWLSQADNNLHSYKKGRSKVISYQKNGRFKRVEVTLEDGKTVEFKTIRALAKFIGKSETQVQRYISNETKHNYKFNFIY